VFSFLCAFCIFDDKTEVISDIRNPTPFALSRMFAENIPTNLVHNATVTNQSIKWLTSYRFNPTKRNRLKGEICVGYTQINACQLKDTNLILYGYWLGWLHCWGLKSGKFIEDHKRLITDEVLSRSEYETQVC